MIPNLSVKSGCLTKHPFKTGCLGFQVVPKYWPLSHPLEKFYKETATSSPENQLCFLQGSGISKPPICWDSMILRVNNISSIHFWEFRSDRWFFRGVVILLIPPQKGSAGWGLEARSHSKVSPRSEDSKWAFPRKLQHTPGAHPWQSPYPTMKGFPLQPIGKGLRVCSKGVLKQP